MEKFVEIIVETPNPEALERMLQQSSGCIAAVVWKGLSGGYLKQDGGYVVRCFAGADFLKSTITQQGYGKILSDAGNREKLDY